MTLANASLKRVTMPLGPSAGGDTGGSAVVYNPFDIVNRFLVLLPVTTTRWRLRFRNYCSLTNTAATAGLNFTGCWLGTPDFTTNADGLWRGNFTAAPSQALSSGITPGDGSDYVTAWVTDPTKQIVAGQICGLSTGLNLAGAINATFVDDVCLSYTGSGCSADAGDQGTPTGGVVALKKSTGDWRLEYEAVTSLPIVVVIGDSIMQGYSVGPAVGLHQFQSCPGVMSMSNGLLVSNWGLASTRAGSSAPAANNWAPGGDWKWQRAAAWNDGDLGSAVALPDAIIINLGSNDVAIDSAAASAVETSLGTVIANCRALGVQKIFLSTIIPRNLTTTEAARTAVNNWIRTKPYGVAGVCDFDKALYVQATPATVDADYMSSYPHPTPGGYNRMADAAPVL